MRLFHFTCDHAATKIIDYGALIVHPYGYGVLWLTDLETPDALELGLTSFMVRCNRMAYRFEVDTDAQLWTEWAHHHHVPLATRMGLDGNPGARPRNWWVTDTETPIRSVEPYGS